jgi:hypothetical protein
MDVMIVPNEQMQGVYVITPESNAADPAGHARNT